MSGKLVNMDAGLSLRMLMTESSQTREEVSKGLGVSLTTISILRRNKLMSGSNMSMLCKYFDISPSDFIRKGESK
jgi:DNA-binding Xre family transcriptional regulator